MHDWKQAHREVIFSFLRYLNEASGCYVLKGGTALLSCYGLDRFSEDIDLDGQSPEIVQIVEDFCVREGYTCRVAKDTDTVRRCMIHYGSVGKPLKVEVSYRRREIPADETAVVNGILVYRIEPLCIMKANAYAGRDKIRDLYDLTFICNHFFDELSPQAVALVRSALEFKGIEQFDYITREQSDELVDTSKLAGDFLELFDRLGLLYDSEEKSLMQAAENRDQKPAAKKKDSRER